MVDTEALHVSCLSWNCLLICSNKILCLLQVLSLLERWMGGQPRKVGNNNNTDDSNAPLGLGMSRRGWVGGSYNGARPAARPVGATVAAVQGRSSPVW